MTWKLIRRKGTPVYMVLDEREEEELKKECDLTDADIDILGEFRTKEDGLDVKDKIFTVTTINSYTGKKEETWSREAGENFADRLDFDENLAKTMQEMHSLS
ncbi:hypothetical protein KAS79_03670 [Candidatus Parcubacteria bacterium]|nr:hypothetical protein [Candidatus Parcubacteria bacterium]